MLVVVRDFYMWELTDKNSIVSRLADVSVSLQIVFSMGVAQSGKFFFYIKSHF